MVQKTTLTKVNDAYYKGYYTTLIRREVAKKFNLAQFFPKTVVDERNIRVQDINKLSDDFEKQTKGRKKKLMTEGASYRKIRANVVTPSGLELEEYGIELDIENLDLKRENLKVNDVITEVAKPLAEEIDTNVYNAAVSAATDPSVAYDLTNQWSAKEIEDILADIIKIRNNKIAEGFNFTNVACGMKALTELQIKAGVQGMEYTFPATGATISDAVKLGGMTFTYGGSTMDEKELMAFQADLPALELFYLNYDNPYVNRIPSLGNYAEYAPLINVLKYDNQATEPEAITTFKFTTAVGTYAPEDGKRLIDIADVYTASG